MQKSVEIFQHLMDEFIQILCQEDEHASSSSEYFSPFIHLQHFYHEINSSQESIKFEASSTGVISKKVYVHQTEIFHVSIECLFPSDGTIDLRIFVHIGSENLVNQVDALKKKYIPKKCNCNTAQTYCSGAGILFMNEFSDDYECHYSYSNWEVEYVFTCNICKTSWHIECTYHDRPPYICNAKRISASAIAQLIQKTKLKRNES